MIIRRILDRVRLFLGGEIMNRILDAAEACFEVDPSPKNETWIENLVSHLEHTKEKKAHKITLEAHQKRNKTTQNETK